jgi:argininosuccinate synthase
MGGQNPLRARFIDAPPARTEMLPPPITVSPHKAHWRKTSAARAWRRITFLMGAYLLGTSIARPLIAERQIAIAGGRSHALSHYD